MSHQNIFISGRKTRKNQTLYGLIVAALLILPGCMTVNPATGRTDFTPFMGPEKELAIGKEQHPTIVRRYGGEVDNDNLKNHVATAGQKLADVSEMADSPFTFTVLNSPMVNAFALPGGYIYVTRGILSLFNNESEMASVLGHEIGHVTARHSAKRYNQSIFTGLGVALVGAALKNNTVNKALGYGGELYLASYSRSNEYESDSLGVRYGSRSGFNPYAAADMLKSLDAHSNLQRIIAGKAGEKPPSDFFSTHPNTQDRADRAFKAAQATGLAQNMDRGRDRYLNVIDGMIYGDDVRQGLVEGRNFLHPTLRLTFNVPVNYRIVNSPELVYIAGSGPADGVVAIFGGDHMDGLSLADFTTKIWVKYAEKEAMYGREELTLNGMPAMTGTTTMIANKVKSRVQLTVIHHSPDQAYFFLSIIPDSKYYNLKDGINRMLYSFNKLSEKEAGQIKNKVIRIVTVKKGDTPESLAKKMVFSQNRLELFRVLNGLTEKSTLVPGQRVKLVLYSS